MTIISIATVAAGFAFLSMTLKDYNRAKYLREKYTEMLSQLRPIPQQTGYKIGPHGKFIM